MEWSEIQLKGKHAITIMSIVLAIPSHSFLVRHYSANHCHKLLAAAHVFYLDI